MGFYGLRMICCWAKLASDGGDKYRIIYYRAKKKDMLNYVDGLVSLYLVESFETSETEEVRTFE